MSEIEEEIRKALDDATELGWGNFKMVGVDPYGHEYIVELNGSNHRFTDIFVAKFIANAPTWLRTLLEENELLRKSKADVEHNRELLSKEKQELTKENERLTKERDYNREIYDAQCEITKIATQQLREELAEEKRHAALGWEQSNKWLEENGRLRDELDQVKKERDLYIKQNKLLTKNNTNYREKIDQLQRHVEAVIDDDMGTIQFPGSPMQLIVPVHLDITVEEFFEYNMPSWLRSLLDELAEKDKVLEWYADESEDAARKFHLGLMNSDIGDRARSILSQYKKGDTDE